MLTFKKIILFLFGIVLVVFGNRAAIKTFFPDKGLEPQVDGNEGNLPVDVPLTSVNDKDEADSEGEIVKEPLSVASAKEKKEEAKPKPKADKAPKIEAEHHHDHNGKVEAAVKVEKETEEVATPSE